MPASIGVNLRVTGHCRQGGRKYMEDYFSVAYQQTADEKDLEYAFFGIYDGHGGAEAAAYAKEHLMENIVSQRSFWSNSDDEVLRAVRDGFLATHLAMWKDHENWPKTATGLNSTAGTTASIAFIRRGKIYIGHVGDSGIVLGYQEPGCEDWKAKPLTKDHKPENENEILRIQQCGGKVVAKSGVPRVVWNRPRLGHKGPVRRSTPIDEIPFLAVARSLGDLWSYNSQLDEFVVSPDPDCHVHIIDTSTFRCLVLGTDGLYNMVTPQMAVNVVQQVERHNEMSALSDSPHKVWLNPSKCLVEKSLERWLSTKMRADNTSVVTLMLDPPGPPRVQVLRSRKRNYTDSGLDISMRYDDQQVDHRSNMRPDVQHQQDQMNIDAAEMEERVNGGACSAVDEERKRKEDRKLHSILYNQFTSKGEFLKTEDAKKVCSNSHDRKPIDASVLEEISRRRFIEMRKSNSQLNSTQIDQQQPGCVRSANGNNYFAKYVPQSSKVSLNHTENTKKCQQSRSRKNSNVIESEEIEKDIQINEISSSDNDNSFTNTSPVASSSSAISNNSCSVIANAVVVNEQQQQQTSSCRKSARNKLRANGDEVTTTLLMPKLTEDRMRRRRGRALAKISEEIANKDKLTINDQPISLPSITSHMLPYPSNFTHKLSNPVPIIPNTRVLRERRNTPDIASPNIIISPNPSLNNNNNNNNSSSSDSSATSATTTHKANSNAASSNTDFTSDMIRPCTSTGIRRRLNVVQNLLFGQQAGDVSKLVREGGGKGLKRMSRDGRWKEEQQDLSKGNVTPSKSELVEEDIMLNKASSNLNNRSQAKSPPSFPIRLRNRNVHNNPTLMDININLDKENNSTTNPQSDVTYQVSTRRSTAANNTNNRVATAIDTSNARLATLRSEMTRTRSATTALLNKVTKLHRKGCLRSKLKQKQGKLKIVTKLRHRLREEGLRIGGRGGMNKKGNKGRQ